MADTGGILYIDRDEEMRELVGQVIRQDFHINLVACENLEGASKILEDAGVSGVILDEMFVQREILNFVWEARARRPDISIVVLFSAVDLNLESGFKTALTEQGVRVVAKSDMLQYQRIGELLSWCAGRSMEK